MKSRNELRIIVRIFEQTCLWKRRNFILKHEHMDNLNQFGRGSKRPLPLSKIALKNYFTSIPSDLSLGTKNSRSVDL